MAVTMPPYATWIPVVALLLALPVLSPAPGNPRQNPLVEIDPDCSKRGRPLVAGTIPLFLENILRPWLAPISAGLE